MIKPKRIGIGDTIGIVAPASAFDIEKFHQGVKVFEALGYKVKYEQEIFDKEWAMPGHDEQHGAQFNRMFADKEVKAIFCAEAGYGSIGILSYLDKRIIRKNPKIFVGYSDITTILLYLQKLANMVVFHGPFVSGEIHERTHPLTIEYLFKLFKAEPLGELRFPQLIAFKSGKATGRIVGGNMSLIVESIGKPYKIRTANSILFLEDVGEDLNTIKKYFSHLKYSGKFRKVKGILLGRMVDSSGKDHDLRNIIEKIFKNYDIPILYGFPSGHKRLSGELHVTLPLGVSATIDADELVLKINESVVV
ncbi:MAG: LD-carboxypeptidase [Candidatus Omnitrophota bacterium]